AGRASATPAPRRNSRRFILLLTPEQVAQDDLPNNRPHAVAALLREVEDRLDPRPVAEPDGRPGRVDQELPREVPRDLALILEQQRLELGHVLEAAPARKLPRGIHRLG